MYLRCGAPPVNCYRFPNDRATAGQGPYVRTVPGQLRRLGMRDAAYIVTEPVLKARFRYRFILTDSIGRMAGLSSLRADEVAAFMVYRDATNAIGHMRSGSPQDRLEVYY